MTTAHPHPPSGGTIFFVSTNMVLANLEQASPFNRKENKNGLDAVSLRSVQLDFERYPHDDHVIPSIFFLASKPPFDNPRGARNRDSLRLASIKNSCRPKQIEWTRIGSSGIYHPTFTRRANR
jgi:hypothetical protein